MSGLFSPFNIFSKSKQSANRFNSPDFAFPMTVIANAENAMAKAVADHDDLNMAKAALQIAIAQNSISTDNAPDMAAMLHDAALKTQSPVRSVLLLLEARLYLSIYDSDDYTFSRRVLPLDSIPADPSLWSKDMFALKINSLISEAFASDARLDIPVDNYESLFTGLDATSRRFYPNMYAVLSSIGIQMLEQFTSGKSFLPFSDVAPAATPALQAAALREKLITNGYKMALAEAEKGEPAWLSVMLPLKVENFDNREKFNALTQAYEKYAASPDAAAFLLTADNYIENNSEDKTQQATFEKLANQALAAHPEGEFNNCLKNKLMSFLSESVSLKVPGQILPNKEFTIQVKSINRKTPLYLKIYKLPNDNSNLTKLLKSGFCTPAGSYEVTGDSCEVKCTRLEPGYYCALFSRKSNDERAALLLDDYPVSFNVSGMTAYALTPRTSPEESRLYILDAANGKPLKGVAVTATFSLYNKPDIVKKFTTNEAGYVTIPAISPRRNCNVTARRGNDVFTQNLYQSFSSAQKPAKQVRIFPSLSIFKPGQECEFALVASEAGEDVARLLPSMPVQVILYNASYQPVDTISLTTDLNGRAVGKFLLPKTGMLGEYTLTAFASEGKTRLGSANIRVEEYRQPGFFVELKVGSKDDTEYYSLGEQAKFTGVVKSYSGMPLAGTQVKITVDYRQPWWRFYYGNDATYSTIVTTDEKGEFSLTLDTGRLKDTPYAAGSFEVSAEATSSAGETQKSNTAFFYLGAKPLVTITSPERMEATGDNLKFTAKVSGAPADTPMTYTLVDSKGNIISSGSFPANGLSIAAALLPSAQYKLTVTAAEAPQPDVRDIIIFRSTDKTCPIASSLWLPYRNINVENGEKKVKIPVGASHPGQNITYVISDTKTILGFGTIIADNAMTSIEAPVPASESATYVNFFTSRDADVSVGSVSIYPPKKMLDMEVVSFRDKIMAGVTERWKFRYTGTDTQATDLPVIATLSNQALNAIAPFSWEWINYHSLFNGVRISYTDTGLMGNSWNLTRSKYLSCKDVNRPDLFTYDQPLYPFTYLLRGVVVMYECASAPDGMKRESKKMAMASPSATNGAMDQVEEAVEEESEAADSGSETPAKEEKLRPVEMPLAWFKPMLATDAEGNLDITFDVPDFNTTWQLQLLAYNPELIASTSVLSTVASKPVMVQSTPPRFMRTGDHAILPATIFNNSGETAPVAGKIQLFDPLTGQVIASQEFSSQPLADGASRPIAIEFVVPDNVEFLGFKVMANSGQFTDGEQSLIHILPSSSPVTETYPFYLAPGTLNYESKLPKMKEGMATLQFCDNPVWYCVTALPSLSFNKDASVLSLANKIYGNSIATGLVKQYPQISSAIKLWSETGDSTLISALERNPELKIAALENTPWVNNASAETLRMQQLSRLLDTASASAELSSALDELLKRQASGGGWSWCDGMEPSSFITGQILWRLAMLHHMGYSPASKPLASAEANAVAWVEAQIRKDVAKVKDYQYDGLLGWFYVRSFFKDIPEDTRMSTIKKKALNAIRKNWKDYTIYNAATAATLLFREGYPMQAREILESLRQRASQSKERGMWFDNLNNSWGGFNTLVTTAQVLEAFAEITPDSPCIDSIRQWLIIERQANDWGTSEQLAEVVWSILSSGSAWTDSSDAAEVTLNGRPLTINNFDRLTGNFTLPLDYKEASGAKLSIRRSGSGPAWGGIATRYIAPIADVKAFSESDVKITKRLLLVVEDEQGVHTESADGRTLRPGDKVRVELTVTSSRNIEYAAITDEQAGCLTPADPLSGYKFGGETGYYREVREGLTNLFIPFLPKGKFLITYDCYAEGDGTYALGIATLQSLYAPMLSAHSAGTQVSVKK